jgi:hypothetical protein
MGASRRLLFLFPGLLQHGAKELPVYGVVKFDQGIARLVNTINANIKIEEADLCHAVSPGQRLGRLTSENIA